MNIPWSAIFEVAAKFGFLGFVIALFVLVIFIVYSKATVRPVASKDAPHLLKATMFATAGFFVFTVLAYLASLFVPEPTQNVDVALVNGGKLLSKKFVLFYSLPDRGRVRVEGDGGYAEVRGIPRATSELHVVGIECADFKPKSELPSDFEITAKRVRIEMIHDVAADPPPADSYPNANERVPPRDTVMKEPRVDPKQVIFKFKNGTGKDGRLALYSCTAHYQPWTDDLKLRPKWLELPFPASADDTIYESFRSGSGWFVFYFQAVGTDNWVFLGTKCLFDTVNPRLVVDANDGTPVGTFE